MKRKYCIDPILRKRSAIGVRKACALLMIDKAKIDNVHIDDSIIFELLEKGEVSKAIEIIKHKSPETFKTVVKNGSFLIAQVLGISRQAVYNWIYEKVVISANMAKSLHEKCGISLSELRPDLFN